MKSQSNTYPEKVQVLGINTYAYNYNIQEIEGQFCYDTEIFEKYPTRGEVINRIVTTRYPDGAENAILRKAILDPENEEFVEYYAFVESIKKEIEEV